MLDLLVIEIKPDDGCYHAAVINLGDDALLPVSNSAPTQLDAEYADRATIDCYARRVS